MLQRINCNRQRNEKEEFSAWYAREISFFYPNGYRDTLLENTFRLYEAAERTRSTLHVSFLRSFPLRPRSFSKERSQSRWNFSLSLVDPEASILAVRTQTRLPSKRRPLEIAGINLS